MAEAAAAHLPDRNAAGGDDRADRDRRLVADAAGRVLVDDLAAERGAEVERAAAADHRVGERVRLGGGHAAEVDGHAERGELVVGDLAARVAEDQLGDLLRRRAPPRSASARSARRDGSSRLRRDEDRDARGGVAQRHDRSGAVARVGSSSLERRDEPAHVRSVGERDRAVGVAALDAARSGGASSSSPFSRAKTSPARASPPTSSPELQQVVAPALVTATSRPPGRRTRASSRKPAVEVGHVVEHPLRRRRSRTCRRRTAAPGRRPRARRRRGARASSTIRGGDVDARRRRQPSSARIRSGELARPAADLEHALRARLPRPPRTTTSRGSAPSVSSRRSRGALRRPLLASRTATGRRTRVRRASRLEDRRARDAAAGRLAAEPGVHGRADVGELALVDGARSRSGRPRRRAGARAPASGRSTASSGRSRGRT